MQKKLKFIVLYLFLIGVFLFSVNTAYALECGGACFISGVCDNGVWFEGCEDSNGNLYKPNEFLVDGDVNNCLMCKCTGISCEWQPNQVTCTDLFSDFVCVFDTVEPPSFSNCVDRDVDEAFCTNNVCTNSFTWTKSGEDLGIILGEWEYSNAIPELIACCGDDGSENFVTQGVGSGACCIAAGKCVDSGNICQDNVAENTVALCLDGIDNDCNNKFDNDQGTDSDPNCCVITNNGVEICDGSDNDCDGTIDEGCDDDNDNYCDSGMTIQGTPPTCTSGGGDCNDNDVNINPGITEVCTDGIDNNCNKDNDDALDNDANTGIDCKDLGCAGNAGPGGVTCCQTASNCSQDECVIESCVSNQCTFVDRGACDSAECSAGQFCDAGGSLGGTCKSPDVSSVVCLNCVADQTTGSWTATVHEDAGIAFSGDLVCIDPPTCSDIKSESEFTDLFDSDGLACSDESCSGSALGACGCFDPTGATVNHKSALVSGACCGDDANEFYKKNNYGGECVGNLVTNVNDCVWSTGDAQASNTGNIGYWCYEHEWYICDPADANRLPIGTKTGDIAGGNYVTCAGVEGNQKWTITNVLKTEKEYGPNACSDGKDNDGDGLIDLEDPDCFTIILRECKEYKDDADADEFENDDKLTGKEKFGKIHRGFDENTVISPTDPEKTFKESKRRQIKGDLTNGFRYYACDPDDTDVGGCADPNSCVYGGVCFGDGTTIRRSTSHTGITIIIIVIITAFIYCAITIII